MEDMAVARINGGIITWALKRSGATLESLATTKLTPARLADWVSGEDYPSEGQAEDLADRLGIPYAMLYMPSVPPDEPIEIPDLRTIDGRPLRHPSIDFLEVIDDTMARQEWYRSEISDRRPLEFVKKFDIHSSPAVVASDMRKTLLIDTATRESCKDYEAFLKYLVARAEDAGILVMRSSLVRHITSRTLEVKEFRGFALVDDLAPVVFINDNDAKAAQIFTLAHELVHIWIGAEGISDRNPNEKANSKNAIELFCDKVAAEILVPASELSSFWSDTRDVIQNARLVSQNFKVSTLVALRRAKDLNYIAPVVFFSAIAKQYDGYIKHEQEKLAAQNKGGKKRGGNFWASFDLRNSARFNATVAIAIREQRTTYSEAGALFGINPGSAARYMKRLGAR